MAVLAETDFRQSNVGGELIYAPIIKNALSLLFWIE